MLPPGEPKFRRRPADRPEEILAAALEVFAERGFAAARVEEVARRAGVSKGAVYLYFETKEALFRAVVTQSIAPNLNQVIGLTAVEVPFESTVRAVFTMISQRMASDWRMSGVIKLVIAESRNQPELARIWHEAMIAPALGLASRLIEAGQRQGAVRHGDARYFAMGLMGPVLLSTLWRETFEPIGAEPVQIDRLIAQHVETCLKGMRP
ncbi:TetR/AcrR family transcriptional regulator [Caulobacter henricii]|uniref:TetR family transcriptional regulator n=1 Tax=Caulobacter henricii TaxID=69395 RepID=A0A0P0NYD5_9CAUL|nr:TetR/AcrR family transcriptional regulator [Caulobacter henricii]ALL13152.1 TetR family transcriptional regulator [Caulobacter henricii]